MAMGWAAQTMMVAPISSSSVRIRSYWFNATPPSKAGIPINSRSEAKNTSATAQGRVKRVDRRSKPTSGSSMKANNAAINSA